MPAYILTAQFSSRDGHAPAAVPAEHVLPTPPAILLSRTRLPTYQLLPHCPAHTPFDTLYTPALLRYSHCHLPPQLLHYAGREPSFGQGLSVSSAAHSLRTCCTHMVCTHPFTTHLALSTRQPLLLLHCILFSAKLSLLREATLRHEKTILQPLQGTS